MEIEKIDSKTIVTTKVVVDTVNIDDILKEKENCLQEINFCNNEIASYTIAISNRQFMIQNLTNRLNEINTLIENVNSLNINDKLNDATMELTKSNIVVEWEKL